MKMKNVVIVAGLGLVGLYAAKKLIDRKKAKIDEVFEVMEENEVVDVECEEVIDVDERICPDYVYEEEVVVGKAVNDNIEGAAKFEGLKDLDKWLEKYERKAMKYFKENPDALAFVLNGIMALLYGKKYGLKGFVGYVLVVRFVMKYANEIANMFHAA